MRAKHHGAGAHGAGLQGDVESGVAQAPAARDAGGVAQHEHLGVGGGVVTSLALVAAGGDHLTFDHEHGPHRHLTLRGRAPGLLKGQSHEATVVGRRGSGQACDASLGGRLAADANGQQGPPLRPTVK